MAYESSDLKEPKSIWKTGQVLAMASVCLLIGLAVGYLIRGSAPATKSVQAAAAVDVPPGHPSMAAGREDPKQVPTLDQMKKMADKQAEPLLQRLKADPNNPELLNDAGKLYRVTHQFKTAASYYQKSLDIDPKNVGARTDLASCLYYDGDVDGALAQLDKSLSYDPKHAGTLLNLGIIEWQGKHDAKGAIAAWQKLLKLNPNFENKEAVQHMIDEVRKNKTTPADSAKG